MDWQLTFFLFLVGFALGGTAMIAYQAGRGNGFLQAIRHPPKEPFTISPVLVARKKGGRLRIFLYDKDPGDSAGELVSSYPEPLDYFPPEGADGKMPIGAERQIDKPKSRRPTEVYTKAVRAHGFKSADDLERWLQTVREDMATGHSLLSLCREHVPPIPESTVRAWLKRPPTIRE